MIQAQHDDIEIAADQSVRITATNNHVMIGADRYVITLSFMTALLICEGRQDCIITVSFR